MRKHGKLKSSKNTVSGKLSPGKLPPEIASWKIAPLSPRKCPPPKNCPGMIVPRKFAPQCKHPLATL